MESSPATPENHEEGGKDTVSVDSPGGPYLMPERMPSEAAERYEDAESPQNMLETPSEEEHEAQ